MAPGTGRPVKLDLRCGTALFGAFGIEWDLTSASVYELDRLATWVARHRELRPLLHSGRVVRPESPDPAVLLHGVIGEDAAVLAHVQLEESAHNRGLRMRVPGLPPGEYDAAWIGPLASHTVSRSTALPEHGPTAGEPIGAAALAHTGLWFPRRPPQTIALVRLTRRATG